MKPKTMQEALEHIIRRLQMDIDDGSRPDQWSMEDLVRVANDALALQPSASAEPVQEPTITVETRLNRKSSPPPVTAAREQEASATGAEPARPDVLRIAKEVGLIGWISDDGRYFEFTEDQQPSKRLIEFAKRFATPTTSTTGKASE